MRERLRTDPLNRRPLTFATHTWCLYGYLAPDGLWRSLICFTPKRCKGCLCESRGGRWSAMGGIRILCACCYWSLKITCIFSDRSSKSVLVTQTHRCKKLLPMWWLVTNCQSKGKHTLQASRMLLMILHYCRAQILYLENDGIKQIHSVRKYRCYSADEVQRPDLW